MDYVIPILYTCTTYFAPSTSAVIDISIHIFHDDPLTEGDSISMSCDITWWEERDTLLYVWYGSDAENNVM